MSSEPTTSPEASSTDFRPLRIWPPIIFLAGMLIAPMLPTLVEDGPAMIWMAAALGPTLCGILILLWWLIGSRASGRERVVGFFGCVLSLGITGFALHKSMQGPGMLMVTVPMGIGLFAVTAVLCSKMLSFKRTVIATLVGAIGFGFSTLLRTEGVWGNFSPQLSWRWTDTAEDQLLAKQDSAPSVKIEEITSELDAQLANPEWPGFRGAERISRVQGTNYASNWQTNPPEEVWKVAVGPGWSSFAVAGNLLFTQEQRGPMDCVVCYDAASGNEVWVQQIESRFEEAMSGPGPRATPTLSGGQLYAMGAEGYLMRLDPKSGDLIWKQDLRAVADCDAPMWGFSSSPLVVESVVIVHAGGDGDKGVLAFDIESGDLRWSVAAGKQSYSSPQLAMIDGERLVLLATDVGVGLIDPFTGSAKLNYEWKHQGYRALQPQMVGTDSLLIPTGVGTGTRRIRIMNVDGELAAEEMWTTRDLKSDYNDFVIHEGYAYGFDGTVFTCIDLNTGKRQWKGGRYGKGQVLLLADSGLLLVASEKGEAVLLAANPTKRVELGKFKAIEGKTWNHPVVVGDRLYIRNGQEAACLRLALAGT